ncbi:4-oxalocrotonate tautomerase family protein [Streptomyces sp. NPDC058274]|jgi:4-oxalocrotonate tautomerase|uniref:tautomerase family protein n=1 Tax=unclassified Streptomyces TaxID=2593676 RepID=UPI00365611AF
MPVIHVTVWKQSDEAAKQLIEEITATTQKVLGLPLDKITVYLTEVPANRWGEAGALGSDPDFAELSRRR